MNIKKKLKKFFTLQKHADGGFTLVELIIVIAILAILAGAAVPAYNGYTNRAREAADQRLLETVNKAFGAACLESGIDSIMIPQNGAWISVNDAQTIEGLSSVDNMTNNMEDATKVAIATDFMFYMLDNDTLTFSSGDVKSLRWEGDHFEIDKINSAIAMVVFSNGNVATLNQAAVNAIMASVFADMGSESLKTMLKDNIASAKTVLTLSGALGWLGVDIGDDEVLDAVNNGSFKQYFTAEQLDYINKAYAGEAGYDKSKAQEMVSNSTILYAADAVAGKDVNTLHNKVLSAENPRKGLNTMIATGGMGGTLVGSATKATMYEAFINSEAGSKYKGNDEIEDALMSDDNKDKKYSVNLGFTTVEYDKYDDEQKTAMDEYDAWLKTEDAKTQLGGYVGAMTVVNDNVDAVGQGAFIDQGMENEDVNKLLDDVIGTGSSSNS